jgi:uncharacterized glyoxalase superfamily protein PhnB
MAFLAAGRHPKAHFSAVSRVFRSHSLFRPDRGTPIGVCPSRSPFTGPDMKTRFSHTVIHVGNVVQSVEWYENVFGLGRKYLAPDGSYAEMDTGDVILSLCSYQLARKTYPTFTATPCWRSPAAVHLCFTTDDVTLLYKYALSQGAVPIQGPTIKPWGQEEAWIRDLNGVPVAILSSPKLNSISLPNPPALPD